MHRRIIVPATVAGMAAASIAATPVGSAALSIRALDLAQLRDGSAGPGRVLDGGGTRQALARRA